MWYLLTCRPDSAMGTLEALCFDNLALRALPLDSEEGSRIREVRHACYSRVNPTPVERPRLVAASAPALLLLDLALSEVHSPTGGCTVQQPHLCFDNYWCRIAGHCACLRACLPGPASHTALRMRDQILAWHTGTTSG